MGPAVEIESLAALALESEAAIVGLLLLESHRLREVDLAVTDFGLSSHRTIYAAFNALDSESETWDELTFADHLRYTGKLEEVGGIAYLSSLSAGIPRRMATDVHVRAIQNASSRWRGAQILREGLSALHDATRDPGDVIPNHISCLQHLLEGSDRSGNLLPYQLPASKPARRPELICLSSVEPQEVDWLWEPYLPSGMLSMLSGDPGGGKTFLTLAIGAALSNGSSPYSLTPRRAVDTGSQANGDGRENSARERIWFSPHCLGAKQRALFG